MFISKIKTYVKILLRLLVVTYCFLFILPATLFLYLVAAPVILLSRPKRRDWKKYAEDIKLYALLDLYGAYNFVVKGN